MAKNNRNHIVGYIIFWSIVDEVHILNLCVAPEYLKQGVGSHLLQFCLEFYKGKTISLFSPSSTKSPVLKNPSSVKNSFGRSSGNVFGLTKSSLSGEIFTPTPSKGIPTELRLSRVILLTVLDIGPHSVEAYKLTS